MKVLIFLLLLFTKEHIQRKTIEVWKRRWHWGGGCPGLGGCRDGWSLRSAHWADLSGMTPRTRVPESNRHVRAHRPQLMVGWLPSLGQGCPCWCDWYILCPAGSRAAGCSVRMEPVQGSVLQADWPPLASTPRCLLEWLAWGLLVKHDWNEASLFKWRSGNFWVAWSVEPPTLGLGCDLGDQRIKTHTRSTLSVESAWVSLTLLHTCI